MSEPSDPIRIAVQQPGYLRIGTMLISILSVMIPLLLLTVLLLFSIWYLFVYFRRFRKRVKVEAREALEILHREFGELQTVLRAEESALQSARKTKKLTKAESDMIQTMDKALQSSQQKVEKEIADITELTKSKKN